MIIPQRHNNPRIVTAGCSVTLIITAGSICSGAFFLPPGFPRAAINVALTRRPGCERHINSILRSVVRELVLHRVILTLWVKEDLGGFHWTEPTRVGCDWQNQHRGHVSESVRGPVLLLRLRPAGSGDNKKVDPAPTEGRWQNNSLDFFMTGWREKQQTGRETITSTEGSELDWNQNC